MSVYIYIYIYVYIYAYVYVYVYCVYLCILFVHHKDFGKDFGFALSTLTSVVLYSLT